MEALVVLGVVVILLAVVWVVGAPLRRGAAAEAESAEDAERELLEAAKEAKYREIRDAELDFATGKLDEADHRVIDRQLRAEAMEILRQLDRLGQPDR